MSEIKYGNFKIGCITCKCTSKRPAKMIPAKKQTENITRSCRYLLLKTLFYFISQCTSIPYLESGLCKLGKELDNCNFTYI